VTLLVQLAAVLLVVEECVVARSNGDACHADPVQYVLSGRRNLKVVLLAFRPTPPELSAALPLNVVGMVAALKTLPFAGVVTDATVGGVASEFVVVAFACADAVQL
jgi:hypothetical protein